MSAIRTRLADAAPCSPRRCVAPPAADAAWTVKGRGFGHGVGLSQYGAYGFAKHGARLQQILDHYYTHTKLGTRAAGGCGSCSARARARSASAGAGPRLRQAACSPAALRFARRGRRRRPARRAAATGSRGCGAEGKAASGVRDRRLRALPRQPRRPRDRRHLLVINAVGVEAYVKGVVPERDALVVAARRAARAGGRRALLGLATSRRRRSTTTTTPAARSTAASARRPRRPTGRRRDREAGRHLPRRGRDHLLLLDLGRPDRELEFGFPGGNPVPYLKSVKDPFDDVSPVHEWTERFSDARWSRSSPGCSRAAARDRGAEARRVAADRPRARRRRAGSDDGQRRHAARPARPAVDLGEVHPPVSTQRVACAGSSDARSRSVPRARREAEVELEDLRTVRRRRSSSRSASRASSATSARTPSTTLRARPRASTSRASACSSISWRRPGPRGGGATRRQRSARVIELPRRDREGHRGDARQRAGGRIWRRESSRPTARSARRSMGRSDRRAGLARDPPRREALDVLDGRLSASAVRVGLQRDAVVGLAHPDLVGGGARRTRGAAARARRARPRARGRRSSS